MTAESSGGLRVHTDGSVMRLTLCNAETRNAQSPALWAELADAGAQAAADGVAVIVLDSEGPSFSAGLDRRMFTPEGIPGQASLVSLVEQDDAGIEDTIRVYQDGFRFLSDGPYLTIALVQGHAVGAGFQLALAADLIVCADDAKFSMKEAAYGLVPDLTGTSPLVRTVGYARALEICLTTRWVEAREAVELGLAVGVVPGDELAAAGEILVQAATKAVPGTAPALKQVLRSAVVSEPEEQRLFERRTQAGRLRYLAGLMGGSAGA